MRRLGSVVTGAAAAAVTLALVPSTLVSSALAQDKYRPPVAQLEDYVREPMPPGFGVQHTDVDGPVFVDSRGMTLYKWPLKDLRNGDTGDRKNKEPFCANVKYTENSGLMSPYPPGLVLPELDTRPTCEQVWLPVKAPDDAKDIGKWTTLTRYDGTKQWAHDGLPLYLSILDKLPGEVYGATARETANDAPALREPAAPKPNVPPAFNVKTVATGRLLVNHVGFSVYMWDKDGPNKSNCYNDCLKDWTPVQAPQTAQPQGEWGIIERAPGIKQWTYRTRPVYTRVQDRRFRSMEGSDVPGWHNVYTQKNPDPPQGFTVQDARIGQVLADSTGKTIYVYNCADDALDQLYCDHPNAPQVYRMAICGGNDAARCLATFPYVIAPANAKTNNKIWGTMWIDPMTGKEAEANAKGAMHIWTFRDRPIYTHSGDEKPGDTNADAWGEFNGYRNGFKAFWLRDDFLDNVS
jgi:predicted lipoprotein with Yx(FWY)xxD motif